uniref:MerR family DNA-binding transcriptional regulator n=1 Tax=unclassified Paenibacillus TaxID=185978 RepID=UPI00403ED3AB
MSYTIGQLAEKMNISAHTLRCYDKEGLLPFVTRSILKLVRSLVLLVDKVNPTRKMRLGERLNKSSLTELRNRMENSKEKLLS